jgi:hypothetical protein
MDLLAKSHEELLVHHAVHGDHHAGVFLAGIDILGDEDDIDLVEFEEGRCPQAVFYVSRQPGTVIYQQAVERLWVSFGSREQ